ncbi:MAG: FAD-dependent oxidoreductase [Rhodospirillaceae bacterium]|nr:FAD-dependent oxidoreductase [Rhodospirillaceae bacterium]
MTGVVIAPVVIVGGGQAGAQCALSLRQHGFTNPITIIGDEPVVPYERPPLSKDFLKGVAVRDRLFMRPAEIYAAQNIALRLGETVTAIDRASRVVRLGHGEAVPYAKLVLATGGRVRTLAVPGGDLAGIHYLRTLAHVEEYRDRLTPGARVVMIGGGYIGLEAAAAATARGCKATVIEAAERVLARVTAPELSRFYEQVHRGHGVEIYTNETVTGFASEDGVLQVECGTVRHAADLVIVGIGISPNVELARAAGLEVNDGIVVDDCTRTADPDIYAIGDCSNHPDALYGGRQRVESVPNALGQGKACAAAILGQPMPFTDVPWFWSDQFDLKLQMNGVPRPGDRVVIRGDMAAHKFSACYLRNGVLVACQAVNSAKDFIQSKKLIAARARPDPARLGDANVALKDLEA